jgi:hypothetical protein
MKKEIDASNLVPLSTRQLNNLKQREGRKLSDKNADKVSCTLSEFLLWVEQRTQIPDDDDEVNVVSYVYDVSKTDPTKIKTITCFLTTKKLAKLALLSEFSLIGSLLFLNWQFSSLLIKTAMHIHCDGTYKLIWQGHTLIVGGTTDKAKQWHQLGVCISKNEKSRGYEFFFQKPEKSCV